MALDNAADRIRLLEGECDRLMEASRKLEARDAKREARLKQVEADLAKTHEANRNLRTQLSAGPVDTRRDSAIKLASERAAELETFKQQTANLNAQKAKLEEELNTFKTRAESTFNALKKALGEKEAQLKDLSTEFDRICAETGAKPKEESNAPVQSDGAVRQLSGAPGDGGEGEQPKGS
jgi:chromosome segregation ATPase